MNNTRGLGKKGCCVAVAVLVAISAWGLGGALAAPPAGTRPATGAAPVNRSVSAENQAAAKGQFDKANALYKQGKYPEAKVENDKALALDPANSDAILMRQALANIPAGVGTTGAPIAAPSPAQPGKLPLLTMSQVNLIRALEMSPNERVTGRFDVKVLEEFWNNVMMNDTQENKSRAAHDRFVSPTNFPAQLRRIKQAGDLKYLQGITNISDPATLVAFKGGTIAGNFVLQNSATAECHASTSRQAGNFRLVVPATTPEQQYTNFYILTMYSNQDGKMIDRDNPEKSLVLQYSLPYANATLKHPQRDVRRVSGLSDPRLRAIYEWTRALAFPKPNYGITYDVPTSAPVPPMFAPATGVATQATRPATR